MQLALGGPGADGGPGHKVRGVPRVPGASAKEVLYTNEHVIP